MLSAQLVECNKRKHHFSEVSYKTKTFFFVFLFQFTINCSLLDKQLVGTVIVDSAAVKTESCCEFVSVHVHILIKCVCVCSFNWQLGRRRG